MKKTTVDALGQQCPIPVVKATRALGEMTEPGILEVLVDNEIAVQNLQRMAAGHHLTAKAEKLGEQRFARHHGGDGCGCRRRASGGAGADLRSRRTGRLPGGGGHGHHGPGQRRSWAGR